MADIRKHKILVIDFGSQYTQIIARRIRELGIYCAIHPHNITEKKILQFNAKGIILSGGPDNVHQYNNPKAPDVIFDLNIPILGICYGMQTMAVQLGGSAVSANKHEYGFAKVRTRGHSELLRDIQDETNSNGHGLLNVWMSHGVEISKLPDGFKLIASTDNCDIAGFANAKKHYYGLQFHPEVTHTTQGVHILERFVIGICKCSKNWTSDNIIQDLTNKLQQQIGKNKVLLAISGGVDSSVLAALLHKIIGKQLVCIFVDNGLLRLNEGDEVMQTFSQNMGIKVIRVNAQQNFYNALVGVNEPEQKRKIIGKIFIEIFNKQAKNLGKIKFLAQGTIYPDVIESAVDSKKSSVIKSHHNVGGLPDDMKMQLVEPLRELFKDEVRKLGAKLNLAKHMLERHPFPGPGLGVRILGEVKEEYINILQLADNIFISELKNYNLYEKVSQAFSVFLPVKSVGVTGDKRRYEFVIALRAVETIDFMTADWAHLAHNFLSLVSNRIINEIPQVSRVVYDISGKPPATIEWE